MFDVGMGVVRPYASGRIGIGEISSIHDDADGETLITVMYDDGAVKVYTENAIMKNLGRRIIVTETPM
mgnify:FL=1|tara:strand:- start:386 stop:589 length:204 start_codon:yes stop_codon:yes gene_type:complete